MTNEPPCLPERGAADSAAPADPQRPSRWVLYRIDDNGNETDMRHFTDRPSAERAMREYESRGHKQVYLIRKE